MVRKRSVTDGCDSANAAAGVRVVLAGARDPFSGLILNVDLATGMVVPATQAGHDGHRVLHVVDERYLAGKDVVHEFRKVHITDPGHAVRDGFDWDPGVELQSEVDSVEQGDRSAEGMSYSRHTRVWVPREQMLHGIEHIRRGPVGYARTAMGHHRDQERADMERKHGIALGLCIGKSIVHLDQARHIGEKGSVEVRELHFRIG
jgi:hypothetical protein